MNLISYFKALSDETRLRLFNLLLHHELNVNEIVMAMDMGQSRISRHLKILTDSGLLASRRDGLWVFYRAAENGDGMRFTGAFREFIEKDRELSRDLERIRKTLQERSFEKTHFFNAMASDWDRVKSEVLGDIDIIAGLAPLVREGDIVADLGCGTGELLVALQDRGARVIGVDKSTTMLDLARKRFVDENREADLRMGELEHLPMRDREATMAVLNMVLHYLPSPRDVIMETSRVLQPESLLVIVDLEKHGNEDMRSRFEHRWLGFDRTEMERWLTEAGFIVEEIRQLDARQGLTVNIFLARKGD